MMGWVVGVGGLHFQFEPLAEPGPILRYTTGLSPACSDKQSVSSGVSSHTSSGVITPGAGSQTLSPSGVVLNNRPEALSAGAARICRHFRNEKGQKRHSNVYTGNKARGEGAKLRDPALASRYIAVEILFTLFFPY